MSCGTDLQATRPWLLERLQQAPAEHSHGFYEARKLTTPPLIHDTLDFPEYLLVSANHTRRDWREAHRLKNVVMLMEYVPVSLIIQSNASEPSSGAPLRELSRCPIGGSIG